LLFAFAWSATVTAACSSSDREKRDSRAPRVDAACASELENAVDGLPDRLSCTGLYRDIADKETAPGVREYAPAVPLWSDGAEKRRWVSLPEGETIDATVPGDWSFPVGTSFFKEFSVEGRRIETRIFRKTREDRWVRTSYQWADDESDAIRSEGADLEDVQLNGTTYHIPSGRECNQCHEGRQDRILGFEAISLGLPGASGISLAQLVDEGLLSPPPERVEFEIGDDGTGVGSDVMGWMHVNCGVSCHNDNGNSEAYSTRLRLRLEPDQLDGRPSTEFAARASTVDVPGKTVRWQNEIRIVPGAPEESLLYKLVESRAGKNDQMPPIGSRVVDEERLSTLKAWILALGAPSEDDTPPDREPTPEPSDIEVEVSETDDMEAAPDEQATSETDRGNTAENDRNRPSSDEEASEGTEDESRDEAESADASDEDRSSTPDDSDDESSAESDERDHDGGDDLSDSDAEASSRDDSEDSAESRTDADEEVEDGASSTATDDDECPDDSM
jgi:hypothetical protein